MLQIYCGNGKGKTTAAIGLAARAAGNGMSVHIAQLMKGSETGEIKALALIPQITVSRCDKDYGFVKNMDEKARAEITKRHNFMLREAERAGADMLIIDEFFSAYEYGLLDRDFAERLVLGLRGSAEVVLTGRDPARKFIDAADYVSEIAAVKHPYESGTAARKGIEY